jgi:hypothetical protein
MPRFTFVSVENNISEYNVLWEKIRSLRSLYDTVVKHIRVKRLCLKLKETILSMWFISLKREVGAHKTSFSQPLFYWSACTKQGKWAVMFVSDIEFASYYHCSIVFSNSVIFFPYHYIFLSSQSSKICFSFHLFFFLKIA